MPLLILALACTSDPDAWWTAGDVACPDGATLFGRPRTRPPDPGADVDPIPSPRVYCATSESLLDRHGPYTDWWSNGQRATDAVFRNGAAQTILMRDPWGRVTIESSPDEVRRTTRTWWHHDGPKAITGHWADGRPVGEWLEWDESGAEIGRVTFRDGVPGELIGPSPTLLYAAGAMTRHVRASDDLQLPVTRSLRPPRTAINIVVARSKIVVDGSVALSLFHLKVPETQLRGHLITKLYDALNDKVATHETLARKRGLDWDGRVLVQLDADTPSETIKQVLYTAGQAGLSQFDLVGDSGVQWPPRTGPEEFQGGTTLTVVPVTLPVITQAGSPPVAAVVQGDKVVRVMRPTGTVVVPCHGGCDRPGWEPELARVLAEDRSQDVVVVLDREQNAQDLVRLADIAYEAGHDKVVVAGGAR